MNYFLFARPSFVAGVAQIVDLGNTLFVYNESNSPNQADYMATKNDWALVGDDLRSAIASAREMQRELQPQLL
jgi:hypothetical protein